MDRGSALQYFGAGLTTVYNNIFAWAGYDGSDQGQNAVVMDDRPKPPGFPALKVYLFNNTIVGPRRSGISFYNDYGTVDTGNIIANNIITSPGLLATHPAYAYLDIQANPHVSLSNNLTVATPVLAGLVNALNSNFHLLPASPAIDSGLNLASYGITNDMDGNPRPYGKGYDIGAYEYSGGVAPSLIANAGPNQTITLPVNSVTLDGSHSFDPNGTITNYSWSELSGPSIANISNNSVVSTPASALVRGTYIFNLVVRDDQGTTSTALDTVFVNPPNIAPTVNAGSPQTVMLPTNTVTLQGVVTGNNGATIQTTSWTELSGPSAAVFGSQGLNPAVSGLIEGVYVFQLSATDNNGLSSSSNVTITVNPANISPSVNAGGAQTITLPNSTVNLSGTALGNGGATISSTSWTELSGPNTASVNSSGLSASVTGLIEGTYVFQLTATDNHGLSGGSNVTVVVNAAAKQPPTVNAGTAQTITLPVNTVTLTGTATGNAGASISSTSWTQTSGPNPSSIAMASSPVTNATGLVAGIYVFQFAAVDNNGLSGISTVTITVNAANTPPNVYAGSAQTINLPASSATLTGTASGNNGATISSIQWKETKGPNTAIILSDTSLSTSVTGLVLGFYVFQLTATDNNGLSSVSTVFVTVNPVPNLPPIARAGPDQSITLPVDSAKLDGTGSSDPDGTIDSYAWTELSGPGAISIVNSNTATATAENLQAGQYVFELTVVDNSGAATTAQVTITVNSAVIKPPIANAGHDTSITIPADTAVLNGSASSDPTGTITTYLWTELSGPSIANIFSSSTSISGVGNLVVGDYVFGLTVTDNHGMSSQASVKVHVVSNLRFTGEIKLYPNPAHGIVNLRLISDSVGSILVNIYDINGRIVQSSLLVKDQEYFYKLFDISGLTNGVYILETVVGIDNIMSIKFIKQ